jgi:hypothetical protein
VIFGTPLKLPFLKMTSADVEMESQDDVAVSTNKEQIMVEFTSETGNTTQGASVIPLIF